MSRETSPGTKSSIPDSQDQAPSTPYIPLLLIRMMERLEISMNYIKQKDSLERIKKL